MTPNPDLHPSLDTMTKADVLRLLSALLADIVTHDPESERAQQANLILQRLPLLESGQGVDPTIHRALAGIAAHLHDAEIRLSQLARGA